MTALEPPLRVEEAAPLLNLSPSQLYAMAQAGEVPHIRIGRLVSFLPEHIREIREAFTVRPERAGTQIRSVTQLRTRNARGPQRRTA